MLIEFRRAPELVTIKVFHTAVWASFVGCILGIPVCATKGAFRWAAGLSVAVLVECAILAFNGGRCPLTDMARRYSDEARENFDIYLPLSLARHNKAVFGTLFFLCEIYLVVLWAANRN